MNYLLQLGYRKCGSTLLAAILDAHPNAAIALDGTGILSKFRDLSRDEILATIRKNVIKRGILRHTNYNYDLRGRCSEPENLDLIGTKGAWEVATLIGAGGVEEFRSKLDMPLKLVHSTRPPKDIVSGIWAWKENRRINRPITEIVDELAAVRAENKAIKTRLGLLCFEVNLKTLVSSPATTLTHLAAHLELPPDQDWLDECVHKIFTEYQDWNMERVEEWGVPWTEEAEKYMDDQLGEMDLNA